MKKFLFSILALLYLCSFHVVAANVTESQISAANFLASKGIIVDQRSSPKLYELENKIQRQAVMKVVMKLSGREVPDTCRGEFADVDTKDWPCKYIESALDAGYIAKNNNFRPYDAITKTEAMKLILRSKGVQKTQVTPNWQEDYMMTAYEYGIITQKYYNYNDNATRGWIFEIATATIEREDEIFEAGGIISDEVSLLPTIDKNEDNTSTQEDFLKISLGVETGEAELKRGENNIILASYNLTGSSQNIQLDGTLQLDSVYGDFGKNMESLTLIHRDWSGKTYYIQTLDASEIGEGDTLSFEIDDFTIRGVLLSNGEYMFSTLMIVGDISQDAEPNSLIALRVRDLPAYNTKGQKYSNIENPTANSPTMIVENIGVGIDYESHGMRYLHDNSKGVEIGKIIIKDQTGDSGNGILRYQSITLKNIGTLSHDTIEKVQLQPVDRFGFAKGIPTEGFSRNGEIVFSLRNINSGEYGEVFLALMVDTRKITEKQASRDVLAYEIVDIDVEDSNDQKIEYIRGLRKTTQGVTFIEKKNYKNASVEILSDEVIMMGQEVATDAGIIKVGGFALAATNENVYIENLLLKKFGTLPDEYISTLQLRERSTGKLLSSGVLSNGEIRFAVELEIFAGYTKDFDLSIEISPREVELERENERVVELQYPDSRESLLFQVSDVTAFNENMPLRNSIIPNAAKDGFPLNLGTIKILGEE